MIMKMYTGDVSNEEPVAEEQDEGQLPDYEVEFMNFPLMIREFEDQLIIYRASLMQRLVGDPFYRVMNVSPASQIWMLRHLKHLASSAEDRYEVNLMQFFELMNRDDVATFFRQKNAPTEMIVQWDKLHPSSRPGPS